MVNTNSTYKIDLFLKEKIFFLFDFVKIKLFPRKYLGPRVKIILDLKPISN